LRGSTAQEQNGQPLEALSFEEKVDQVQELLAGLDCSRCGYASCRENAEAIVQGESPSDSCVEASPEARERIRQIVGLPERVPWTVSLWRTLTSVKLAIGLIIVLALFSILGTLVPQGQPDLRYLNQYGPTGYKLIKFFSVDRLFHTWYYLGLLVLLGLSTLACLTKRFRLSLRLLCRPRRQSPAQILKLENSAELAISGRPTAALERVTDVLRKQGYRVTRTGNQLYAHKNLVGRLGVDLFHASLLLLLLGALAGGLFGFEGFIQGHKGEVLDVPNADFQIRVDDLWVEHYEGSTQVKDWYTTLTVIDDGQEVKTQTIEVNHPLTYQGVSFYQASFGTDWLRNPMLTFQVLKVEPTADAENATGKGPESLTTPLGEYEITLEESFPVDPEQDITAKLLAFYPDFAMTDQGPINRSLRLNNPAAFLEIYRGDQLKFRGWTFAHFPEMQIWVAMETESNNPDAQPPAGHGSMGGLPYRIDLVGMRAEQFTGLQVSYNPAIWVIYLSFVLMGLGMFLNFYLPPRWAWASAGQGRLVLAVIGRDDREVTGEFEALVEQLRGALPTAGEPSSAEASESHPSSTR
jgi:cytochrome c biogenesis protein